tara:strand:+ start:644 stop:847 length:204 start_codon:yes stop_codon:yes gene_type:complete
MSKKSKFFFSFNIYNNNSDIIKFHCGTVEFNYLDVDPDYALNDIISNTIKDFNVDKNRIQIVSFNRI